VTSFIHNLSIAIIPFDELKADVSASLYPETKKHGMSFADRACLALGVIRSSLALTSECKMGLLSLPVKVKVIRNAG